MRPIGPGSYKVTARLDGAGGHLELGSTDHFKGTEPVQHWVRPEPRWPTSYYRSAAFL